MTSSRTVSITAVKKVKMADLLRFFSFYINNLTLWAIYMKSFFHVSCSNLLCMLLISSSQTSSIIGEQKFKMAD